MINFDDFKKIELKVGKVLVAEKVDGSEKLLRLEVDLGEEEKRQIVAGIATQYEPEQIIGKEIIVVANLEPRELFGLESRGMLLAAKDENGLALLAPDKGIKAGAKVS